MIALNRSRQIILVSVFSVPVIVTIGAIGHLVSLDASTFKPLNVPSLEMGKTEPDATTSQVSIDSTQVPTIAAGQTDRERENVALAKLQDEQWLIEQEKVKAAKNAAKKKNLAKITTSPVVKPIVVTPQKTPLKISSVDIDNSNLTLPSMQIPQANVQFVGEPIGSTRIVSQPETFELQQTSTSANDLMGTTSRRQNFIPATIAPEPDAWSQSAARRTKQLGPNSVGE